MSMLGVSASGITIETVPVGNTGNLDFSSLNPDVNRGAVDYEYNIGKYPVTIGEYTAYLNAMAQFDPNELYDEMYMSWTIAGPRIERSGSSGSYQYTVAAEFENRPMNYVNFPRALRFANWLHNGQPIGVPQNADSTENGAYDVNESIWSMERKPDWQWAVASVDEWVKAGYHKNDGDTGNYWLYPTSSDDRPGFVTENDVDAAGKVIAADPGNTATWNGDGTSHDLGIVGIGTPWFRTEVGEHENSASPYGTFDQGGQVWEMTDTFAENTERIRRGGNYEHGTNNRYMQVDFTTMYSPADSKGSRVTGFRVVSRGGGSGATCTSGCSWNSLAGGNWNLDGNWTPSTFPNGIDHVAIFGPVITESRTIFTDSPVTVNKITFDNTFTYAIAGTGNINFAATSATSAVLPSMVVQQGTHEFQVRVNLNANATADIASGATLEFVNRLNLGGKTLTQTGDGTLLVNNSFNTGSGTIVISGGVLGGGGKIGGDVTNSGGITAPGNSAGSSEAVPEPSAICLLILGASCVLGRRGKR